MKYRTTVVFVALAFAILLVLLPRSHEAEFSQQKVRPMESILWRRQWMR
jgi:hypothetical protein